MATDTGHAGLEAGLGDRVDEIARDMAGLKEELVQTRGDLREALDALQGFVRSTSSLEPQVRRPKKLGKAGPLDAWFDSLREVAPKQSSAGLEGDSSRRALVLSPEMLVSVLEEARSGDRSGPALSLEQLDRSLKRTPSGTPSSTSDGDADSTFSVSLNDLAQMVKQAHADGPNVDQAASPKVPSSSGAGVRRSPTPGERPSRSTPDEDALRTRREATAQSIRAAVSAIGDAGTVGLRLDVNLLANLVRWVGSARNRLGLDNLQGMLETYVIADRLPGAIQMAIYQAAGLNVVGDDSGRRRTTADDIADTMLELHGIVNGSGQAPACPDVDFDLRKTPLTDLVDQGFDQAEAVTVGTASSELPQERRPVRAGPLAEDGPSENRSHAPSEPPVSPPVPEAFESATEEVAGVLTANANSSMRAPVTPGEKADGTVRKTSARPSMHSVASATRKAYPSDITDGEWRRVEALVPPPKSGGRPHKYHRREILNGILYQLRTHCSWRGLPQDLPPWKIVHHYFRTWREQGAWHPIAEALGYVSGDQTEPYEVEGSPVGTGLDVGDAAGAGRSPAVAAAS